MDILKGMNSERKLYLQQFVPFRAHPKLFCQGSAELLPELRSVPQLLLKGFLLLGFGVNEGDGLAQTSSWTQGSKTTGQDELD